MTSVGVWRRFHCGALPDRLEQAAALTRFKSLPSRYLLQRGLSQKAPTRGEEAARLQGSDCPATGNR